MARVYSTQFCSAAGWSGGPLTVYTVPPNRVAVIKSMTIVWGVVTITALDAWFQSDDLTKLKRVTQYVTYANFLSQGGSDSSWGSWVLDSGQQLQIQTAIGTADFHASGYELDLP